MQNQGIQVKVCYYQILDIPSNATFEDLKAARRKMSLKFHPDKLINEPDYVQVAGENKMKAVNNAYEVLSDAVLRAKYDATLTPPEGSKSPQSPKRPQASQRPQPQDSQQHTREPESDQSPPRNPNAQNSTPESSQPKANSPPSPDGAPPQQVRAHLLKKGLRPA
ncbi:DnaJ-domain-containing protein [Cucurbitaria berberidis CBS 394.84]|uniref:DnaJ-domain-containing protein n=1 Tax=Cucurbitaria berberidis CBS 394.84 TaxID=1168544 RepID=A0A9P4GQB0_9PLEO|nr:DnaJ-domain-containing protein [Cucurbitaria berberidis CBS 394.84]KAF1849750.1 DnaJ-domain-containing protein [Cucurbitaria berberidis CBS 394.84]